MRLFAPIPALVASTLLGATLITGPVMAQSADTGQVAQSAKPNMGDHHKEWSQRVEKRITELHQKLQIKAEQEQLWGTVAQTMRDNATALGDLMREARGKESDTSAIEDLQNYQKIAQAHADGAAHLVSAFQPLYDSMSPEQKKVADTVFEEHRRHGEPQKKGKQ